MAACACCVCIGGVNYTKACSCKNIQCCLSMATSKPNVSVSQSAGCGKGCGGAAGLTSFLNVVGKWGTVLTATAQNKPVSTGGVKVGTTGATSLTSGTGLILLLLVVGVGIYLLTR